MQPIAIVGIGALFPGSKGLAQFWNNILAKKDLITDVPADHWLINDYYSADLAAPDKTYSRRGGFIPPTDFNPLQFGVPPNTLPVIDASQLLGLIVAKQVLDDAAANQTKPIDLARTSIILGVTGGQGQLEYTSSRLQEPIWRNALQQHGISEDQAIAICDSIKSHYTKFEENTLPGTLGSIVAGRIANRLNLGGTNCTCDAACASSLSAINMAIQELLLNKADMVITGGVDTCSNIGMYVLFSKTTALSLTDDCRPFDKSADGTILAQGLGFFALKRLSDAERDGDKIYAVIRGIGSSSDGRAKSIYAPVAAGQVRAIARAYDDAGYNPDSVELVEAHGTGTKTGDAVEFEALKTAFTNAGDARRQQCALGSVKSQIGHAKAAAGAASLFKVVMGLQHKILPPMIKVTEPNPALDIESSPFYISADARPWIRDSSHPRRAAVSSFGFGGTNFHLTVEEYAAREELKVPFWPEHLFVYSTEKVNDLISACKKDLMNHSQDELIYAAKQSQLSYQKEHPVRLCLVVSNASDLHEKLTQVLQHLQHQPETPLFSGSGLYYSCSAQTPGKIAVLFPGLGSEYLGMSKDLTMAFNCVRQVWDECAQLEFSEKQKLHDVVFPVPVFDAISRRKQTARLTLKHWAQPAISTVSVALYALLEKLKIKADCFAGKDIGELTGMHISGVLNKADLYKTLGAESTSESNSSLKIEETISKAYDEGIRIFIEVGPGNTLTRIVQQNLQQTPVHIVPMDQQNVHGVTQLWHALAKLFVAGINPAFEELWLEYRSSNGDINKAKSTGVVQITGTTYGKPYPYSPDKLKKIELKNISKTPNEDKQMASQEQQNKSGSMQAPVPADHADWRQQLQAMQKQTIDSHNLFQRSMVESHMSFLKAAEKMAMHFVGATKFSNGDTENEPEVARVQAKQEPEITQDRMINLANAKPVVSAPLKPVVLTTTKTSTALKQELPPSPSRPLHQENEELSALIIEIIADKTGYPIEMLSIGMSLESDLGIDSIKRVEIFSSLQEKISDLPETDIHVLASIQTIGDIVDLIAKHTNKMVDSKKK